MRHRPGEPSWIELFTPDTEGARTFYADLFGWTSHSSGSEYGHYLVFENDSGPVAGCMHSDGTMGPAAWSVYLASDDVEATAARATAHGGQVVAGPVQVGSMGHMAFVIDPAGASVGVWQPLEHPGFASRAVVGAPSWFEVITHRYDDEVAFYREVFGWETHVMGDAPEFRYTTLGKDEGARAGIMDGSGFLGNEPSRWQFYLAVADADVTSAAAAASGGTVVREPEDTPYGRIAVLKDPAGIEFCIMANPTG